MNEPPTSPVLRQLRRDGDAYRFLLSEGDLAVLLIADTVEDCNDAACRLLGRSRKALLGFPPLELSPETQPDGSDSATGARQRMESALAGLPQWSEWRFRRGDGTTVDTLVHVEAVRVDGARRLMLRVRDISDLQRAEVALAETELRLKQILDNSTRAVVFAKDLAGRYLFVNHAFERLAGRPQSEIVGRTTGEIFANEFAAQLRRNDQKVIRKRRALEFEEQVPVNGEPRTMLGTKFPLFDRGGEPYAVCGISTDITDRKRAEESMRRAAIAVSTAEGEGVFRELTRSLAAILGVDIAFIALPVPEDRCRLRMLAFHVDGRTIEHFEYSLAGTPCETVIGREYRVYPSGLQALFPMDEDFQRMGAESYAGHPLNDAHGQPLGLISVVSRRPLSNPGLVESMLKIFAARVVTEIERMRSDEALRASQEQYLAIFAASADGLALLDADGRIVDANPAFTALYGFSLEELLGTSPKDLVAPESGEVCDRILAAPTDPVTFTGECRALRRGGEPFDVELRGVPMHYRGRPHRLVIVRDITERKTGERALRRSEDRMRATVEAALDPIVIMDADGNIVEFNPAAESAFGHARSAVIGRSLAEVLIPERLRDAHTHGLLRYRESGHGPYIGKRIEVSAIRSDGSEFPVELAIDVAEGPEGKLFVGYLRDITERRRADAALRTSESQYRAVFNAWADALVLRDAEFRIVDVNQTYETFTGRSRDEVLGIDRVLANPPGVDERVKALHGRVLAGEPIQLETQILHVDGTARDLELRGVPIRHQGRPHVLYIGRDITERKRAESERLALEAQLRQAQKMEAIGHLTGGIAHDFNNILTSILGYLVLAIELEVDRPGSKVTRYLEQAQRASQRARDLIQQMLTFSRGQRGDREPVLLPTLIEDSNGLLHSTLSSSVELEIRMQRDLPATLADPVQIEQVLLNLCINARDAMSGAGRIGVAVGTSTHEGRPCSSCRQPVRGRFVELAVQDSGPGIASEVLDRMFEPFFTTKEVGKGSGMGLSMVHGIIHQHGGHVLVDSTPGHGATFRVLFVPLADQPAAETVTATRGNKPARRTQLEGRVLVVDDETMVGEFMAELLSSWGLAVTVKASPVEAERWFADNPDRVDLVVTDQTMPRLTGLELACRLTTERPELPVILYTGYGEDITAEQMTCNGVVALVKKPVEPSRLLELLRAHLPHA